MQAFVRMFRVCVLLICVLLCTTEAEITGWTTPTITGKDGTGTLTVSENQAISETIITFAAITASGPVTYTLVTAVDPFVLSDSGELSITAYLDAETATTHTLEIQAVDSDTTEAANTGIATITVTVTDVTEAPVFGQTTYTTCIANESPEDTSVITVMATKPDPGDDLLYSIDSSSNTNSDFDIDGSSGEITVNTGKTLDMTVTPAYSLVVVATEDNSAPKSGTATVSIEVTADGICSGASAAVVNAITIILAALIVKL